MEKETKKPSTRAKKAKKADVVTEVVAAPQGEQNAATPVAAAPSEPATEAPTNSEGKATKPRAPRKKAAEPKSKGEKEKTLAARKSAKKQQPQEAEVNNEEAPATTVEAPIVKAEEPAVKAEKPQEAKPKAQEKAETKPAETVKPKAEEPVRQKPAEVQKPVKFVKPKMVIHDIVELAQAPSRQIILNDQQIQQLTLEDAEERHLFLEETLARVLDYDVVLSDTNIWLELLVGHTSSHSDPRVNARLQFERQLEFISRMTRRRKGIFMMMAETYEEIDRFATQQDPASLQDADFQDQSLCLNIAARLAKRLILSQQRENRLRIEGIGAESHHAAFADPAIIRRTVEFFSQGKKVLLITNDASVGIRSMGLCDDLQRFNGIDDETWEREYAPLRPMVFTFDDLKLLDQYTRQYHFIQQAAGKEWMEDVPTSRESHDVTQLRLWMEAFRPGDRHRQPQPQMPVQNNQQKQQQQKQKQQNNQQNNQQKQGNQQNGQQNNQQKQQKAEQQKAQQKQEVKADNKPEVRADNKQEEKPTEATANDKQAQPQTAEAQASAPIATPQLEATAQQNTSEAAPKEETQPKPKRRGGRRSKKPQQQNQAPAAPAE